MLCCSNLELKQVLLMKQFHAVNQKRKFSGCYANNPMMYKNNHKMKALVKNSHSVIRMNVPFKFHGIATWRKNWKYKKRLETSVFFLPYLYSTFTNIYKMISKHVRYICDKYFWVSLSAIKINKPKFYLFT